MSIHKTVIQKGRVIQEVLRHFSPHLLTQSTTADYTRAIMLWHAGYTSDGPGFNVSRWEWTPPRAKTGLSFNDAIAHHARTGRRQSDVIVPTSDPGVQLRYTKLRRDPRGRTGGHKFAHKAARADATPKRKNAGTGKSKDRKGSPRRRPN